MSFAAHMVLLTLIASVLSNPDRNPDCRKFVFAPICRGVAAKRSQLVKTPLRNGFLLDENKLKDFLKGYKVAEDWMGEGNTAAETAAALPIRSNSQRQDGLDLPSFYDYDHVK